MPLIFISLTRSVHMKVKQSSGPRVHQYPPTIHIHIVRAGGENNPRTASALYVLFEVLSHRSLGPPPSPLPSMCLDQGGPRRLFHIHTESAWASKCCQAHPSPVSNSYRGPHNIYCPRGSLYEGGKVFEGPFPSRAFHTLKTSYAGTTDVRRQQACMPTTIVIAGDLVNPLL